MGLFGDLFFTGRKVPTVYEAAQKKENPAPVIENEKPAPVIENEIKPAPVITKTRQDIKTTMKNPGFWDIILGGKTQNNTSQKAETQNKEDEIYNNDADFVQNTTDIDLLKDLLHKIDSDFIYKKQNPKRGKELYESVIQKIQELEKKQNKDNQNNNNYIPMYDKFYEDKIHEEYVQKKEARKTELLSKNSSHEKALELAKQAHELAKLQEEQANQNPERNEDIWSDAITYAHDKLKEWGNLNPSSDEVDKLANGRYELLKTIKNPHSQFPS